MAGLEACPQCAPRNPQKSQRSNVEGQRCQSDTRAWRQDESARDNESGWACSDLSRWSGYDANAAGSAHARWSGYENNTESERKWSDPSWRSWYDGTSAGSAHAGWSWRDARTAGSSASGSNTQWSRRGWSWSEFHSDAQEFGNDAEAAAAEPSYCPSSLQRSPEQLHPEDTRFDYRRKCRKILCDGGCDRWFPSPEDLKGRTREPRIHSFDGEYVERVLMEERYGMLKRDERYSRMIWEYENSILDVRWWCLDCHVKYDTSDTLAKLSKAELRRMFNVDHSTKDRVDRAALNPHKRSSRS